MNRIALVTGGTGFLGSWLMRSFIEREMFKKIYVLARPSHTHPVQTRVYNAFHSRTERAVLVQARKAIQVIASDLCEPKLGLPNRVFNSLVDQAQAVDIFHVAALADLGAPIAILRRHNVEGTRHLLQMALSMQRNGNRVQVHHISTAMVAGNFRGQFTEEQLDCGQRFHNAYEQSKFEAEQLIHVYRTNGLNVNIYRPGIITGDSKTGATTSFKMFYQPLHFLALGLFKALPATPECMHSLMPVDKVAEAVSLLSQVSRFENHTWHLVNPHEISLGYFISLASRTFRFTKPTLIPLRYFPKERLTPLQWNLVKPYIPYFNYCLKCKAVKTNNTLASFGFNWPPMNESMLSKLFQYCIKRGFIPSRCP